MYLLCDNEVATARIKNNGKVFSIKSIGISGPGILFVILKYSKSYNSMNNHKKLFHTFSHFTFSLNLANFQTFVKT